MSLFERFVNSEKKQQEEEEQQTLKVLKKQCVFGAASSPAEDQTFHAIQEGRADFLKWQQELEGELLDLVMTLRGWKKNEKGVYSATGEPPLCNELFIDQVVVPQCKPFFSKNLINSHLDSDRILLMLRNTSDDICDAIADAWDTNTNKYAIMFTNQDLIMRLIKNEITPAPFRALKGWTKKTDSEVVRRIEAITEGPENRSNKGFSSLFKK